jgi:hypothetical protein
MISNVAGDNNQSWNKNIPCEDASIEFERRSRVIYYFSDSRRSKFHGEFRDEITQTTKSGPARGSWQSSRTIRQESEDAGRGDGRLGTDETYPNRNNDCDL